MIIWMEFRKDSSHSVSGKYSFLMLRERESKGHFVGQKKQVAAITDKEVADQM
ncbi:MAG: hypothetical protein QF497_00045 [Verrucomicrobiota bacterium]|nr:hypothetical protein [Verrucomicrobiota bacterium]